MNKPTPPPWYSKQVTVIYLAPNEADAQVVRVISSGPNPEDPVLAYVPVTWPEDEANAELIRRAVNSHADLVSACRFALKRLLEKFRPRRRRKKCKNSHH